MALNDTDILKSNEFANVMYNAFLKALEENSVKFSQKSKVEDLLVKELSTLGKITEKEQAKIRTTIENGFKKGGTVRGELQKYFKDLVIAINNKETSRIRGASRTTVSTAYPETEKLYRQREDSLRRSSLSKYNRVSQKLARTVEGMADNSKTLSETSASLSRSNRKLSNIANSLIDKATKLEDNISWIQSATGMIGKSTDKSSRLNNSLVSQALKIDKQVGWVESSIENLKNSGRRLRVTGKGLNSFENGSGQDDSGQKQEEDSFINRLVKKLEHSRLGGRFGGSLMALGGALAGSFLQQHGHPILAKAALVGGLFPGITAKAISQISKIGGKALLRTNIGQKLAYNAIGLLSKSEKTLPLAEKLAGAGAVKVGAGFLGKLIPGLGVAAFGADAYSRGKRGDKLGATIAGIGAVGAGMSMSGVGAIIGEPLQLVAALLNIVIDNIKPIGKAVMGLFNLFKPAGEFIAKVFGGLWGWIKDHLPKVPPAAPGDNRNAAQRAVDFAASAVQSGPVRAGMMSKSEAIKAVSNNKYYESIAKGGKGWSVDPNSFINDIMYARSGTSEMLTNIAKSIPGLKITSALGTKTSPHGGKITSTGHYSGTKLDFAVADKSEASAKDLADRLRATGYFSQVNAENVKGQGWHVDAQIAKSKYDEIAKKEKEVEDAKKAMVTPFKQEQVKVPQLLPMTSSFDPTGSDEFARMVSMNNRGRD